MQPSKITKQKRLADLANAVLHNSNPSTLRLAAAQLYESFNQANGTRASDTRRMDSYASYLPHGKAISPNAAGECILDYARTAKFLRGVHKAIKVAQQRFPYEPIEVVYAGCGPFATLVIPLLQLVEDPMNVTLIDVHKNSLDSALRTVEQFGLTKHQLCFVNADAADYIHPTAIHLAIAEVMQRALQTEPEVAVTHNLAKQLCDGGILVPQRVRVEAFIYDPATEFSAACADDGGVVELDRKRIKLGRLIELPVASMDLSPVELVVPDEIPPKSGLLLSTAIDVFTDIALAEYESAITCPVFIRDLDHIEPGSKLEFRYQCGTEPCFEYRYDGSEWRAVKRGPRRIVPALRNRI